MKIVAAQRRRDARTAGPYAGLTEDIWAAMARSFDLTRGGARDDHEPGRS